MAYIFTPNQTLLCLLVDFLSIFIENKINFKTIKNYVYSAENQIFKSLKFIKGIKISV